MQIYAIYDGFFFKFKVNITKLSSISAYYRDKQ